MSTSHITEPPQTTQPPQTCQQSLLLDVEALVAALLADAPLPELIAITDRVGAAVDHWDEIPAVAIAELRSAIDLMRDGKACATIGALLAARSELTTPQG